MMLHKSIWNFIQEYPFEFNEVLRGCYPSLECEWFIVNEAVSGLRSLLLVCFCVSLECI